MLKISTVNVDQRGITLSGQESPAGLELIDTPDYRFAGEVAYLLHAAAVNHGLLLTGRVAVDVCCRCCRCLEEFEFKLVNSELCHFYEHPLNTEIDLTPDIREDIIISFPQNFICGENCRGLCPVCGQNLNLETCGCDRRPAGSDAWSALDQLITGQDE